MTDLPVAKLCEAVALWDHADTADAQPAVREFAARTWHRLAVRDLAFNAIRGLATVDASSRIAKFNRLRAEAIEQSEEDVTHGK